MKTIDHVLNLIFPRMCAVCGDAADARFSYALCLGCGNEFEILKSEICPSCSSPQMMCRCRPVYDGGKNVKYQHLIEYRSDFSKKLVFALKRKNNAPLRRFLASELASIIKTRGEKIEMAYAPRSVSSIRRYGFDQSKELARELSKKTGARLLPLFRHLGGAEQKELGMTARFDNAAESYKLRSNPLLREERLVIVDDVITTGSTVRTLCELATLAGAGEITVLTVAKTGKKY